MSTIVDQASNITQGVSSPSPSPHAPFTQEIFFEEPASQQFQTPLFELGPMLSVHLTFCIVSSYLDYHIALKFSRHTDINAVWKST